MAQITIPYWDTFGFKGERNIQVRFDKMILI